MGMVDQRYEFAVAMVASNQSCWFAAAVVVVVVVVVAATVANNSKSSEATLRIGENSPVLGATAASTWAVVAVATVANN